MNVVNPAFPPMFRTPHTAGKPQLAATNENVKRIATKEMKAQTRGDKTIDRT